MTTTPTNTTLGDIAAFLVDHDDYAIFGHVSPDGDCLGSQLALARALRCLGKRTAVILAQNQPIEAGLGFLPGLDAMVVAENYRATPAVAIALDTPTAERLGPAASIFAQAPLSIVIDHHGADSAMATLSYTDADAPSTSVLIWQLLGELGRDRFTQDDLATMAQCIYTGLVTDTGRFAYQNATRDAFAEAAELVAAGADPAFVAREVYQSRTLASLRLEARAIARLELLAGDGAVLSWIDGRDMEEVGAVRADAEPLIDTIRSLEGVRVACMLRDRGGQIRGSLRAKDDTDVAAIARELGGGGHKAAAGFTLNLALEEALATVRTLLTRALS